MFLKISNLSKSYEKKKVLFGANARFEDGKIFGLLGRNGSGKTTFMNIIADEIPFNEGEISLCNDDSSCRGIDTKDVIYIYSTPVLPEFLTGFEFLKFFMEAENTRNSIKMNEREMDDKIYQILSKFSFSVDDSHRLIVSYSHGMKNKIQMMTILLTKAPIVLLDEPLTSIDIVAAKEIKDILKDEKKDRIIIFSTHILDLARQLCDEAVLIHNGRFERVDAQTIKSAEFEEKVVNILKDDSNEIQ